MIPERIIIMVDLRINETLQTGAVGNRTYRGGESVYLFLEFTIKRPKRQIMSQLAAEHNLQPIDDYFFLAFV